MIENPNRHSGAAISDSADVDDRDLLGDGARIWHLVQVRENATIGRGSSIGRGAYIGPGVVVGENCKIQNYALVYEPAVLEDGVFVGPAVVFTNDVYPRAINPDGSLKSADDWHAVGVTVRRGAAIGARSVCIAPVEIGAWAFVAAGSVVTKDVASYAIVAGVPARQVGWVGTAGVKLVDRQGGVAGVDLVCPTTGDTYVIDGSALHPSAPSAGEVG